MLSRAYGLVKIHKVSYPLRSVIPSINTPTHFLCKTLYDKLHKNFKKPASQILNSFELIEKNKNLHIPDNCMLISLDVSSLFTNIPCDLVLESIDRRHDHININYFYHFLIL